MVVHEQRVKHGYEDIHANASNLIANIEEDVRRRVEELVADDKKRLQSIIDECIEVVEVEMPDASTETNVDETAGE